MLTPGHTTDAPTPTPNPSLVRFTPASIIAGSKLFQDYQRAFAAANGLTPELRNPDSSPWTDSADACADSPCVRLGLGRRSCAACCFFQQKLAAAARHSALTRECHAGLCETAVPVRAGNRILALLQIGRVRLRVPTDEDVARVVQLARAAPEVVDATQVKAELWRARYFAPAHYSSFVQLFEIFSHQLAEWYVQHAPTERPPEPLAILHAKEWIEANYNEHVTLAEMAGVARMSAWHFCRSFHRATGTTPHAFLARTRVAHARQLLADPQATVATTAWAVGFRSLSQFNRMFHKFTGSSPREFRSTSTLRQQAVAG